MGTEQGRFYLGCAVWSFAGWVDSFYPAGARSRDFLRLYGERMTAVEGNTTFYATPTPETVTRWASETPQSFRFCPKLPRAVTHEGALTPHLAEALRFLERMQLLGERLGPLFLQLPATYGPTNLPDLRRFLQSWPIASAPLHVEVRHGGFYIDEQRAALNNMLAELSVGRVVLDTRPIYQERDDPLIQQERRKPRLPLNADTTSGATFVRFVGHPATGRNPDFLDEWAGRITKQLAGGRDVYFFTHCPVEECSPHIARELHARLQATGVVEALPWDSAPAPPQLDLFS